jgi:hypothetical protein
MHPFLCGLIGLIIELVRSSFGVRLTCPRLFIEENQQVLQQLSNASNPYFYVAPTNFENSHFIKEIC